MTFGEFFSRKWEETVSKVGRPPTPEEYSDLLKTTEIEWRQIQKEERERDLAEMEQLSERLFEFAADMEERTNTDDLDGCHEALRQVAIAVMEQLSRQERKEIMENFNEARSRNSKSSGPSYKTEERKREEDPSVMRAKSQIRGFIRRKRNSSADPGDYAGKICLFTRHGWRPIVVPGGIEPLLRELGIWKKYERNFPLNSNRVHLDGEDIFVVEWKRLEDETREFVKIISPMRR